MFLDHDELEDLTGYKRAADQRRWLIQNGYKHELDARNRPKVLRSHVEQRLGGSIDATREPKLRLP